MQRDRQLVERLKQGDKDALRILYVEHKDFLLTLANALLHDSALAEDVVHDVFVKFTRHVGNFRLTGSLKAYLATCAANEARNLLRRRKTRAQPVDFAIEQTVEAFKGVYNLRIVVSDGPAVVETFMLINRQTGLVDHIRMDNRDTGDVTITIPGQSYVLRQRKNEVMLLGEELLRNDLNFRDVINALIEQTDAADGRIRIVNAFHELARQKVIAVTLIRKDESVAGEFLIDPESRLPMFIGTEADGRLHYMGPIEYNVEMSQTLFEFIIPKDATVIDNRPAAQRLQDTDQMRIEKRFCEEFEREVIVVDVKQVWMELQAIVDADSKLPVKFSIPWTQDASEILHYTEKIAYNVDMPDGIFDFETTPDTLVMGSHLDTQFANDPRYGMPCNGDEDIQEVCRRFASRYMQARLDGDIKTVMHLHSISIGRFGSSKLVEFLAPDFMTIRPNGTIVEVLEVKQAYEYERPGRMMVPCRILISHNGRNEERRVGVLVYLREHDGQKSAVAIGFFPMLREAR